MTPRMLLLFFGLAVAVIAAIFRILAALEPERRSRTGEANRGCALALFVLALCAAGIGAIVTVPAFDEPSGNTSGAILLLAILVAIVLVVTLAIRHIFLREKSSG